MLQSQINDGWRLSFEEPSEGEAMAREILARSEAEGNREAAWDGQLILASSLIRSGGFDSARTLLEELDEEFALLGDAKRRVACLALLANCHHTQGNRDRSIQVLESIDPATLETLDLIHQFTYHNSKALISTFNLSMLENSLNAHVRSVALARQMNMPWLVVRAMGYIVLHQSLAGLAEEGIELANQARDIARKELVSRPIHLCVIAYGSIHCHLELGKSYDLKADQAEFGSWLQAEHTGLNKWTAGRYMVAAALLLIRDGDLATGKQFLERAEYLLSDVPTHFINLGLFWVRGLMARADNRGQDAIAMWKEGLEGPHGTHPYATFLTRLIADTHYAQGQCDEASHWYRRSVDAIFTRSRLAARINFSIAQGREMLRRAQQERDLAALKREHSERARAELQKVNKALQDQIHQVEVLKKQLLEQSIRDVLTGLYNRRHLNECLPAQLAQASRSGECVAVAMVDLDFFKRVNDTWGHAMGDAVLAGTAKFLQSRLRQGDIACRYGGEEFCIVMPGATQDMAVQRMRSILAEYSCLEISLGGVRLSSRTFSCGVSQFKGSIDMDTILHEADQALYRAKEAGRNRVESADV